MDTSISILRFLIIVAIVFGHIGFSASGNGIDMHNIIYFYHIPLFFFVEGYLYKKDSLVKVAIRDINKLYIPFVICSIIFILSRDIFINLGFYKSGEVSNLTGLLSTRTFVDLFSFRYSEPLLGVIWIVPCLFFVKTIFLVIDKIIEKIKFFSDSRDIILPFIMPVLLIIGLNYGLNNNFLNFKFDVVLVSIFFYYLGSEYRNKESEVPLKFTVAIPLVIIMWQNTKYGFVDVNNRMYINAAFFLFNALSGIYINLCLINFVKNFRSDNIKKGVYAIGNSFYFILALHFTVFKFITFMKLKMENSSMENLKFIFPGDVISLSWIWIIIYLSLGIGVPAVISKCSEFLFKGKNKSKLGRKK
jgi:fucose 4-O-acetylase-like acetyltransferase